MKVRFLTVLLVLGSLAQAQGTLDKLYQSKQYDEIAKYLKDAHRRSGKDAFIIGQAMLTKDQDTTALRMYQLAVDKGYETDELYRAMALTQRNLGRNQAAIRSLNRGLELYPLRKPLLLDKAELFYLSDMPDSALRVYQTINQYYERNQTATYMVCFLEQELGNPAKALPCYKSALDNLQRGSVFSEQALANICLLEWHHVGNLENADYALQKLMQEFPKKKEYLIWQCQLYRAMGKPSEAEKVEKEIMTAYRSRELPSSFYQSGVYIKEEWNNDAFMVQVFQFFDPRKQAGQTHKIFLFNRDGSRGIRHFDATVESGSFSLMPSDQDTTIVIQGGYEQMKEYLQKQYSLPFVEDSLQN
ncbi:MAG: hypothetical protein LPK46_08035 [Bacteroidota bacterium]|nr:hypothetical protein [Bacteroidota bacterium]MDX5449323.1 hypothetical protein [Bacteroidota bacterium]MDX5506073.1 hypothetical protein [Bacteroidota bacterium]